MPPAIAIPVSTTAVPNNPCKFEFSFDQTLVCRVIGVWESLIGVSLNIVILLVFRQYQIPSANTRLLVTLACLDIGVLTTNCLIYPTYTLSEYYQWLPGYNFWVHTVAYWFVISRMCQMATTYIVVVAALERFFSLSESSRFKRCFSTHLVCYWIAFVLSFTFFSHCSRYFELYIVESTAEDCTNDDFGYYSIAQSIITNSTLYKEAYTVWYTNLTNVVLPFLILLLMIVLNIHKLRTTMLQTRAEYRVMTLQAKMTATVDRTNRNRDLRDSTTVLIILVLSYLCFNALGVVISLWEFIDKDSLEGHKVFYPLSVELINLCAITNSSIRIINYCIFNRTFRTQFFRLLRCFHAAAQRKTATVEPFGDGSLYTLRLLEACQSAAKGMQHKEKKRQYFCSTGPRDSFRMGVASTAAPALLPTTRLNGAITERRRKSSAWLAEYCESFDPRMFDESPETFV